MNVDSPVLSLGLAEDGTPQTPPLDQPSSVGWYTLGPKPGTRQGKVVLTAHTFHTGGALGNELFDSRNGIKPGALIQLGDASGRTQCYRYSHAIKVLVKDYDPSSTVIYDSAGAPLLALVICWDYDAARRSWASRIVFYATPLVH